MFFDLKLSSILGEARAALEGAIAGPTVLTELTATTVVPAHWQAEVLCDGSLILERQA